jgi:4-hydroxybenzoate polyprenyltransferase
MALLSAATTATPPLRVLGRVDNWWYSKVAPALALGFCAALLYRVDAWPTAQSVLLIAFVFLCAGSYGHIVNDVFDIEVDRNAGKRNHMAALAPWQRFALCALTLGLGFAPALFISYSRTSLLLLAIEFSLPTIYSVPPLRLKGRGALGLLCDSLGAHMVPCLYAISVLAHKADASLVHTRRSMIFVACTAACALFLGLNGILIHEFEDRDNDIRSGIRTFATGTEFARVRVAMTLFFVIELIAFAGVLTALFPAAPVVVIAAALFLVGTAIRISAQWHHYRHYEHDATAIQWWQLSHSFYEAYLPVAAAMQCAWIHPELALFPALQIGAFARTFRQQAAELTETLRQTSAWIALGARLDVDPAAKAWAWPFLLPRLGARITVREPGSERWNIRLARSGLKFVAGREYHIRFLVRSNVPRKIVFGVWQDHAPWESLGYVEELQLSSEWQKIGRRFIASSDDSPGYLGVWAGGEMGTVDILIGSIRPTATRIR